MNLSLSLALKFKSITLNLKVTKWLQKSNIEKMKVLSHIFIFAYCVISCIIADEVDEELQRWEEYKVEKLLFKIHLKVSQQLPSSLSTTKTFEWNFVRIVVVERFMKI